MTIQIRIKNRKKICIKKTWKKRTNILKNLGSRTCGYCGKSRRLTIDHVRPKSKGGTNEQYNLIASCRSCNLKKGCHDLNHFKPGKFFEILTNITKLEQKINYIMDNRRPNRNCHKHLIALRHIHDLRVTHLASIYKIALEVV